MKLVTLKNIQKSFHDCDGDLPILSKINLSIENNTIISIVGTSGSGKTTLLNIISGIEKIYEGEIIQHLPLHINYVTQQPYFIDELTVEKNLIFASLKNKQPIDIFQYCSYFQCEHLLKKMPYELSGGEKQRINIIRSLLNNPNLLIMDEPTASLDYNNKIKVVEMLNHINETQNLSIILVTHDKEILTYLNRNFIYELKDKTLLKIKDCFASSFFSTT